jgi:hypothetical protein
VLPVALEKYVSQISPRIVWHLLSSVGPLTGSHCTSQYTASLWHYCYGSTALCWALAAFSASWSHTQSTGLLGREISPSQGLYLHRTTQTQNKHTHRHPCIEWDSNPRSQRSSESRLFNALYGAATVVGVLWHYSTQNNICSWQNVSNRPRPNRSIVKTKANILVLFVYFTKVFRIRSIVFKLNCRDEQKHNIVTCMSDYRRGLDWSSDLLATYTHDWELQVITAL